MRAIDSLQGEEVIISTGRKHFEIVCLRASVRHHLQANVVPMRSGNTTLLSVIGHAAGRSETGEGGIL